MSEKQKLLAEILKLKMYLVKKVSSHTLRVETQEVLDKLNEIIDTIEIVSIFWIVFVFVPNFMYIRFDKFHK